MNNPFKSVLSAVKIYLIFVSFVWAEPFVINSSGETVVGSSIQSSKDGTIQLTMTEGHVLTFPRGSYRQAVADKPEAFNKAKQLVLSGNLESASRLLSEVKKKYRFLKWDQHAGLIQARIYLPMERFDESAREYEELFTTYPQIKKHPVERSNYMRALYGSGRVGELSQMIEEDISSGSRILAARAQVLRGDINVAAGQYEDALLDYMRTVLLFKAQTEVLPEATYKAATVFRKLNNSRAEDYFQKVIDEFPETKYAELAERRILTADNADGADL